MRDVTPLIDHLTGVEARRRGLADQAQLLALRRARGGTSLVVVTGVLDTADLPYVAALRRRFDRLVVISIDPEAAPTRTELPRRTGDRRRGRRRGVRRLEPAGADVRNVIRQIVPVLLLPLCLIGGVLATSPWLRSFPLVVIAEPLLRRSLAERARPADRRSASGRAGCGWRCSSTSWRSSSTRCSSSLHDPLSVGGLVQGLYRGPSQILTFALPLVSPRA